MKTSLRILIAVFALVLGNFAKGEKNFSAHSAPEQSRPRLGFYLHAGWNYEYPFAVHSWRTADYSNMFQLLKDLGFDTAMLWPLVETIPIPLSSADEKALHDYRSIIDAARKAGVECWLTFCP